MNGTSWRSPPLVEGVQFACREEHIPASATTRSTTRRPVVPDHADSPDTIKPIERLPAPRRQLKQYDGNCSEIRCRSTVLAGTSTAASKIPAAWDLPHIKADYFALPELKVGTWDGFVFINPTRMRLHSRIT